MDNPEPTVFIVDDDEAVRDSLAMLVAAVGLPVTTCASAEHFLDTYTPGQAGCLVLDIAMPTMSGLELQAKLNQLNATIPIIFITGHGNVPMAVRAMQSGAMEFIQKPFSDETLLDHIKSALAADAEQRAVTREKLDSYRCLQTLTPREKQVMEKMCAGYSNKRTASQLGISQRTVEIHRANIMQKLGVSSIAQVVVMELATRDYHPPELP